MHLSIEETTVEIVGKAEDMTAIHESGCVGVIWQRKPAVSFQNWIDRIPVKQLPRVRLTLRPNAVHQAVQHICDEAELPEGTERTQLTDDIVSLSAICADMMRAPFLKLRLDVVTTNACRKFHVDAVPARLVCTYRGTGTQYGFSIDGATPSRVDTVSTGSPILLRGTLSNRSSVILQNGAPTPVLLHRSPPIEGTGEARLVLVVDPVDRPEYD